MWKKENWDPEKVAEVYDDARQVAEENKSMHEETDQVRKEGLSKDAPVTEFWERTKRQGLSHNYEYMALLRQRLNKLVGAGQEEAGALNEEYDKLKQRADEALKAVSDFERDRLGMQTSSEEKDKNAK
ncbi:MAG: hypothetical protein WC659_01665 [Patescibacteria group bacterium]